MKCLPVLLAGLMALAPATPRGVAAENESAVIPSPASLTIEELVGTVAQSHPELRFYEAEIAAARAGRKTAGVLANPELSVDAGRKTVRGGGLSAEGLAWSVSVTQPFEWPGRLGLRKAIANRDLELAELGRELLHRALTNRVRTLGFALFAAQEKAATAREVAERFGALRAVLVQREPAGLTPLLETRVIEATELAIRRQATEAELATQSALLELNQLRGVRPETPLTVRPVALEFGRLPDRAALLAALRTNNFELRVRATELAQQGLKVKLARNERYPALNVGPSYSEEQAGGERERILGFGVSLPLPLWNRNEGQIDTARARQSQAEVALQVAERDLTRQVEEAALQYESKRREMAQWRPDASQHFREAAELADRHYRLGAVPVATYVELQKQYLEAVEGLLNTRKEALEAAAQLELLTGLAAPLSPANSTEEKQ